MLAQELCGSAGTIILEVIDAAEQKLLLLRSEKYANVENPREKLQYKQSVN
jgi:hypothetical protein